MRSGGDLDRRSFLVTASAAAGGLTLGFAIPLAEAARAVGAIPEITCWIAIAPDDSVTIRIARSEMGQGSMTGLAMLVAEELECDWSKVRTEFVSPTLNLAKNRIWGDTSTGASRSIASSQDYLRRAGATAREMLIAAAAAQWRVPPAQCVAANGAITLLPSGRTLSFAAIAPAAAMVAPPADVPLKPVSDWKLAGTRQRRLDVPDKVSGQPVYAIDVRLPNMLYAAIRHCPIFGGALGPPPRIGHHRDGIRHTHHAAHAGHLRNRVCIDRFQPPPKHRAVPDRGVEHIGQPHVHGVDRLPGDLVGHIEPPLRRTGERPGRRRLERHVSGRRDPCRGGSDRRKGQPAAARAMNNRSFGSDALRRRYPPLRRCGRDQHFAGSGAGPP